MRPLVHDRAEGLRALWAARTGSQLEILDAVIDQIGTGQGIHFLGLYQTIEKEAEVRAQLAKYGVE